MNTFFTRLAERQLEKPLYTEPVSYSFNPYADMEDFSLTFISVFFLPICNLALTLLLLIEAAILAISVFYYYLTNKKDEYEQSIEEFKKSAKNDFKMLLATIFVALCMLIIFLFRLTITIVSLFSKHNISEEKCKNLKPIKLNNIHNAQDMLNNALANYNKLLDKVVEESKLIGETLKKSNAELEISIDFSIQDIKKYPAYKEEYNKLIDRLSSHSTLHSQKETSIFRNECNSNKDLLDALNELLGSYPEPNFSNSSTVKEIEIAYNDLAEHHQKTVDVAIALFKKLDDEVNCAQNNARQKL